METMNHAGFIVASYAAATIVVVALIAWVMLDFRAQRRNLADLEARGITRRSVPSQGGRTMEQAREDA
ncbi:MAG: heme exporter protein CcmD [Xanthobacteraceae bacterium]|jgi:heme exporter protein D